MIKMRTLYISVLQNEFCKDLVSDTTDTLRWLDKINSTLPKNSKTKMHPFTFDFKSLYDTISPYLVQGALITAMTELVGGSM